MSNIAKLRQHLVQTKDAQWRRFLNQMGDLQQFDFQALTKEVLDLHKTRSIRVLGAMSQTSAKAVGNAVSQDIAARSRFAEICMEVIVLRNIVNKAIKDTKKHIESNYPTTLKNMGMTTVTARRNLLDALMRPYVEKTTDMETLLEIADIAIADCDQAGRGIYSITENIKVATRREFTV